MQETLVEGFSSEQLLQLPWVEFVPADGRVVSLGAFYDHSNTAWHLYLPVAVGKLGRIAGGETVVGSYYAAVPQKPEQDLEFPLASLIRQHLSFPATLRELSKLESDFHRCASILEKYHLLWTLSSAPGSSLGLLVESELEYLLFLLRSFYDVLQAIVCDLTKRLIALDGSGRRLVQDLPDSFAAVALRGNLRRSADEIRDRWNLLEALANWYVIEAPFFQILRELRDTIAHQGSDPPNVFRLDCGFAIDPVAPPWNQIDEWPVERRWQGRLGSLRALFARFIAHAIQATTRFTKSISEVAQLPTGILKQDVRVFLRSPFGNRLVSLEATRKQPWEGL